MDGIGGNDKVSARPKHPCHLAEDSLNLDIPKCFGKNHHIERRRAKRQKMGIRLEDLFDPASFGRFQHPIHNIDTHHLVSITLQHPFEFPSSTPKGQHSLLCR